MTGHEVPQRSDARDPNVLARQVADLRDENNDLRRMIRDAQHQSGVDSVRFAALSIAAVDDGSLTERRVEQIADDAWAAIDRRYWPSDDAPQSHEAGA